METKRINWDSENYFNELDIYDDYFLSFHYDHCQIIDDEWDKLVINWDLNIKIIIDDKDPESKYTTAHNNDYSIVVSGLDCEDIPCFSLILTFSKDVSIKDCIKFFKDFKKTLENFDEMMVKIGITGEFISHPKEIEKIMIEKLKENNTKGE